MCERCDQLESERRRLTELMLANPVPCVVCDDTAVVAAGTWLPDEKHYLAAGGSNRKSNLFSFCICAVHAEPIPENEKFIKQAILREIRMGRRKIR